MSFTPDTLIQIYLKGSLNDEAKAVFDQWMEMDPVFSDKMIEALKTHLGTAPDSLSFPEARLDAQMEEVWAKNKPSFLMVFLKKYFRITIGLAIAAVLCWALIHWGGLIRTTVSSAFHFSRPGLPELEGLPSETMGVGKTTLAPPVLEPLTLKPKKNLKRRLKGSSLKSQPIMNDVSYTYVNHLLQISVDSEKNQKAAITILDSHSRLICNVYQGPWIAGHHVISWSGKDNMGNAVLPGNYIVVVQANGQTTSAVIHFPDF